MPTPRLKTVEEKVEAVEVKTDVTLMAVLAELREVRERLDESLGPAKRNGVRSDAPPRPVE